MKPFPRDLDPDFFDREYRLKPELWRAAFRGLWQAESDLLDKDADFQPFTDGSNLIAAMGDDWIMKVFPPFLRHQWESEYRVMQHLDGRLALPIPRFLKAGSTDTGWTFIIMSRLAGVTLEKVWPRLVDEDKAAVLEDIGRIMERVHSLPVGPLHDLPPAWADFLPQQIKNCKARHERLAMPTWFCDQVDGFVEAALPLLPETFVPVLLTGEYTPFNLLVIDQARVQSVAGMIDFGDAMSGFREYDLLGPLLFSCEGKPQLVNALLKGYGIPEKVRNKTLRRRLFLLQILHRYSNFPVQVRIEGWRERVGSLEELENLIWPLT